ncbi:MAG: NlpC/P60 family protein [Desemzia incerta]|uniref:C40 family peptidase n=1 Tax=Desemzia incerta TaxID=82801 RepID=UPI0033156FEB
MKKKFVAIALLGTMTFSSLILPTQVSAEDYTTQIEEAQQQAESTQTLIDEKSNQLNQIESQVSTTETELKTISNEIKNNEEKTAALAKEIEKAQADMKQLQEEIKVLEEKIAERNEQLKEQARTVQTSGFSQNYIDFILESESVADVIGRIDVVTDLVKANKTLVQEQVADQNAVVEKSEQTEQKINQQNAIAMELEQTRTEMDKQLLEKEVIVAQLAIEKATTEEDISTFLAQKAEAEQQVAEYTSVQAEAEAEAELLQQAQIAAETEEESQVVAATESSQESSEESIEVASVQEESEEVAATPAPESSEPAQTPAPSAPTETPAPTNNNAGSTNSSNAAKEKAAKEQKAKEAKAAAEKAAAKKAAAKKAAEAAKKNESKPVVSSGSVLQVANSLTGKGIPYKFGGNTTSGFDCSGFTRYVFEKAGKSLARNSYAQYAGSTKVTNPQPGDLVFFSKSGSPSGIFHVAIYTGNGGMVGSQSSTGPGHVSNFKSNPYWGNFSVYYGRY